MNNEKASRANKLKLLLVLLIVSALSAGFYLYQAKAITLSVDGEVSEVETRAKTVEDFLTKEEVRFDEGAYINVPLDREIEKDLEIVIINPKPYTIKAKDNLLEILSIHDKVEDILKEQDLELGELDYVEPSMSTELDPNSTIEIFRVKEEVVVEESSIPFKSEEKSSNKLDKGSKKVVQKGKEGLKHTHIKNRYVNGELESSTVEKEEVVKEPVKHIVEKGTRVKVVQTSRGTSRQYKKILTMQATAYTDNKASQGKWVGQTATGVKPRVGIVAVDPKVIPLGSKLYIEGYGNAVAGDTGGAIKGNRIDLFFNTAAEARRFGRRTIKVYILG